MTKSTVAQIRERFDADVERFSNLETGQSATIDAPLSLALIAEAAGRVTPAASSLLDVGCGAGNYSLKLLGRLPNLDVTLVDLSRPMLDRAVERVSRATSGKVVALQGDIRELQVEKSRYDIICAACIISGKPGNGMLSSPNFTERFVRAARCGFPTWSSIRTPASRRSCGSVMGHIWLNSRMKLIAIMFSIMSCKKTLHGR